MNFYKYFSVLIVLLVNLGYSQHVEVQYSVSAETFQVSDKYKDFPEEVIQSMKEAFELVSKIEMTLKASKMESIFSTDKIMVNDANPEIFKMAKIIIGSEDIYYLNVETNNSRRYFKAYGKELFFEKKISDLNWTLTKETKKVGSYQCYKAVASYLTENQLGSFHKDVVAYYTPKISYSFGPKGFGGLPGLILELHDDKFIYKFNKIEFKDGNLKLPKFPNGILISQKELDLMGDKAWDNRGW